MTFYYLFTIIYIACVVYITYLLFSFLKTQEIDIYSLYTIAICFFLTAFWVYKTITDLLILIMDIVIFLLSIKII